MYKYYIPLIQNVRQIFRCLLYNSQVCCVLEKFHSKMLGKGSNEKNVYTISVNLLFKKPEIKFVSQNSSARYDLPSIVKILIEQASKSQQE